MKYLVALGGVVLIVLPLLGLDVKIESYAIYIFISIVLLIGDFSRLKKAKILGVEIEFDQKTKELIDATLTAEKDIEHTIKKDKKGLGGVDIKESEKEKVRFMLSLDDPEIELKKKLNQLDELLRTLHSKHFTSNHDSMNQKEIIHDLEGIPDISQPYLKAVTGSRLLVEQLSKSDKLYSNYRILEFSLNKLIDLSRKLIDQSGDIEIYRLD